MSEINAEKMAIELKKRGDVWAAADAHYHALEEATKSILSQCIADVETSMIGHNSSGGKPLSMAEKEARALRSPVYIDHLEIKAQARKNMNLARVNLDTYKVYMELRRSEEATHRAAMTLR